MKHAILGFLVDQPMHGYELKRKLSPALPRERRMNDGVLYPLLRRMEEDGLVRKRVERGEGGRDRNVFQRDRRKDGASSSAGCAVPTTRPTRRPTTSWSGIRS